MHQREVRINMGFIRKTTKFKKHRCDNKNDQVFIVFSLLTMSSDRRSIITESAGSEIKLKAKQIESSNIKRLRCCSMVLTLDKRAS